MRALMEREINDRMPFKFVSAISSEGHISTCFLLTRAGERRTAQVFLLKELFRSEILKNEVIDQIKISKILQQSSCFVKLEDHFYTSSFLVIVYEHYHEYSLDKILSELELENHLVLILKDLTDALVILRENKLVHRSISPRHIYIINGYVKLGGLEYIQEIIKDLPEPAEIMAPPLLRYLPPEAFLKKKMVHSSQIFSLGIMLFELVYKKLPFPVLNGTWTFNHYREFYHETKRFSFSTNDVPQCEPVIENIIKECLMIDYQERIPMRYLQEIINQYTKTRGSLFTLRKIAVANSKKVSARKGLDALKLSKTQSVNSLYRCKIRSL